MIIDWEHLGAGFVHEDALRYLSVQPVDVALPKVEDLLARARRDERQDIVSCFRWLTLRNLAGHATVGRGRAHLEDLSELQARWLFVSAFAAAIERSGDE